MSRLSLFIKIALMVIIFHFLVWPFINSAISHNYYLKVNTDGHPSTTWIVDLRGTNELTVEVYGRGNIATGQQNTDDHETYQNSLDQSDVDKITEILNKIRGAHLLTRMTNGYAFWFDNQGFQSSFHSYEDKQTLLRTGQILEYYARGDELLKDGSNYKTYIESGRARLKTLRASIGLEE